MEALKRCSLRALPRAGASFARAPPPLEHAGTAPASRTHERLLASASFGPVTKGPLVAVAPRATIAAWKVGRGVSGETRAMSGFGRRTLSPEEMAAAAAKKKAEAEVTLPVPRGVACVLFRAVNMRSALMHKLTSVLQPYRLVRRNSKYR